MLEASNGRKARETDLESAEEDALHDEALVIGHYDSEKDSDAPEEAEIFFSVYV